MRLFLGIPLPREAKDILAEQISSLKGSYPSLRWVASSNYHITLLFLGQTDTTALKSLEDMLRAQFHPGPAFDAAFGEVGQFPREGPPRVVYAGLRKGSADCALMHDALGKLLPDILGPGRRNYDPHITLARSKSVVSGFKAAGIATKLSGTFRADRVTLFESELTPRGAVYRSLIEIALETPGHPLPRTR